ncbi:MAG: hypothetical protein ABII12_18570 [Planctomycetota bacterium]
MTTDEVKTTVKKHSPAALFGGAVGVVLLIACVIYVVAGTPERPDLQTASASQIVAYIADDRGLAQLAQIEQQAFLEQWEKVVSENAAKKADLRACFENIGDDERKEFSDAMFKHIKRSFLLDAKRFHRLPADETFAFLRERTDTYRQRALFIKDVAVGFKKQFTGSEDDLRKWVMEHTTAEDRTIGEPYYQALERVKDQIAREQRIPARQDTTTTHAGDNAG